MVQTYRYWNKEQLSTEITVDTEKKTVQIKNYTNHMIFRAFGVKEHPTYQDFERFLESRCFPRNRDHMKWHLEELGLDFYNPALIVRKTQGRLAGDSCWLELVSE